LEAAIAEAGGFAGVPAGTVAELGYWRLGGGREPGEVRNLKLDVEEAVGAARRGLERLIRTFDDPTTPYLARPRPAAAPRFGDYEHLARIKEWAASLAEESP
jgi:ATP-dependent helicase/nuclease subunit B